VVIPKQRVHGTLRREIDITPEEKRQNRRILGIGAARFRRARSALQYSRVVGMPILAGPSSELECAGATQAYALASSSRVQECWSFQVHDPEVHASSGKPLPMRRAIKQYCVDVR